MDVHYSNESSSGSSEMNGSSSSEELNVKVDGMKAIQPYAFEPVETDSGGKDSGSEEMVSEPSFNSENTRLQDTNWQLSITFNCVNHVFLQY